MIRWRLWHTPADLTAWAQNNRNIRELSCLERDMYNVQPLCEGNTPPPARQPYPTPTASVVPSMTPTIDLTQVTVTPTWTPLPSQTPPPTPTAEPSISLEFGVRNQGAVISGSIKTFIFEGQEGQTVTIDLGLIFAPTGTGFSLHGPDGGLIEESTGVKLGPIAPPVSGYYTVMLSSTSGRLGYNLLLSEG